MLFPVNRSSDRATDSEQLPLFAYGTLRHGQENYWLLRGWTVAEAPATLDGMALYSFGTFPAILENSVGGDGVSVSVYGQLLTLHPQFYTELLRIIDQLEGYRPGGSESLFIRVERCIRTGSGREIRAWTYVGNPAVLDSTRAVFIAHGDWCRYRADLVRDLRYAGLKLGERYQE